MKKIYLSWGLIIGLLIVFCYLQTTKTRLKLLMETTKADGQATRYGVDVINFDAPINISTTNGSITNPVEGSVTLQYTDKPYNDPAKDPPAGSKSLYAGQTKSGQTTWTNMFSGGGLPKRMVCFQYNEDPRNIGGAMYVTNTGNYNVISGNSSSWGNYEPTVGTTALRVICVGAGGSCPQYNVAGGSGGIVDVWVPTSLSFRVTVGQAVANSNGNASKVDIASASGGGGGSAFDSDSQKGGTGTINAGYIGLVYTGSDGLVQDAGYAVSGGSIFGGSCRKSRSPNGHFPGSGGSGSNVMGANGCVWIFEY